MSEKYIIEFDDEKFSIGGYSYRRISGTNTLVCDDAIKSLTPAGNKEEKKTIKDIKWGDKYFFISSLGDIETSEWNNDYADEFRAGCGNAFLTKDEAEFELRRLKIMAIIRKYAEPLDTPWDGNKHHFRIISHLKDNTIDISYAYSMKSAGFYFATEDDAQKVIDEIGKADLLKYYFLVEG